MMMSLAEGLRGLWRGVVPVKDVRAHCAFWTCDIPTSIASRATTKPASFWTREEGGAVANE